MYQLPAGDMWGPFCMTGFEPVKKLTREPEMFIFILHVIPYSGNL